MFKITVSKRAIKGCSHAPKRWHPLVPFKIAFHMAGDGWTDLITHHVWFYTRRKARFVKVVRPRTDYERHLQAVRVIHAKIALDEKLARRARDAGKPTKGLTPLV